METGGNESDHDIKAVDIVDAVDPTLTSALREEMKAGTCKIY